MDSLPLTPQRRLRDWIPFGIGQAKPRHLREMLRVFWANRDNLAYAWKVLSRGACDGCAPGASGFRDATRSGFHWCMPRLHLLRLNTMPPLDERVLGDAAGLAMLDHTRLQALGRLPFPVLRERGQTGFRRISWETAYARIARRLSASDPRRVAFFLSSGDLSQEVDYVAQKLARLLGSNHIDTAARCSHAPSVSAMTSTLGVAAATCGYKDWAETDLLVFFGANPAENQPAAMDHICAAKKRGTRVVLVNPLLEPGMRRHWEPSGPLSALFGSALVDDWFPVTQGGDVAFLLGALKVLCAADWLEHSFLAAHTTGLESIRFQVEAFEWQTLEAASGLTRVHMHAFAELLHRARNAVLVWGTGVTRYSGDAVQMILNLALTQGWLGRPGCGLMPMGAESSRHAGSELGADPTAFPGAQPVTPENAVRLGAVYGFPVPDWTGFSGHEMVEACAQGGLDVFYCVGGRFLRTLSNGVAEALRNVPFRVHQAAVLTPEMFIEPGEEVVLLPAKTLYEQDGGGILTNSERRVIFSPELPRPRTSLGEARAAWEILRDLAAAVDPARAAVFGCESAQKIREEMARVVPAYAGIEKVQERRDPFQLGGAHLCEGGRCPTADGKARLRPVRLPQPRPVGIFRLSSRRGKPFWPPFNETRDALTGAERDAVMMAASDAGKLGLESGDPVLLRTPWGSYEGRVFIAPLAPGNLQAFWPETDGILPRIGRDPHCGLPGYTADVSLEKICSETRPVKPFATPRDARSVRGF
jgi:molybdopterin-dependent oxidoreductase alpha subunit